jgi:hypothetical protein
VLSFRWVNVGSYGSPAELIRRLQPWELAAALAGLTCIGVCAFLACTHLHDLFNVGLIEAVRIVQAKYMNTGDLFPPLQESGYYGATRYMPLPVAMHAAAALVTNDYLAGGKILGAGVGALLLLIVVVLCVRSGLPRALAVGLAGCIAVTDVAISSFAGLGADAVPVIFQLTALGLVVHRRSALHWVLAGIMCALAILAKIAALWAGVAIALWMLFREREALKFFLPAWLISTATFLLVLDLVSGGGFRDNMVPLLFSGLTLTPAKMFIGLERTVYSFEWASSLVVLLPLALAIRHRDRRTDLYFWGLAVALVMLVVLMIERSSAENHLIDVIVLGAVSLGTAFGTHLKEGGADGRTDLRRGAAVVLLFALGYGWLFNMQPLMLQSIEPFRDEQQAAALETPPLKEEVSPFDIVLAENPMIPFARGQRPVVLDPFLFRRMSQVRPEWAEDLAGRIRNREFTKVVLNHDLADTDWYTRYHFGPVVLGAMRDAYRPAAEVDGYFIYVPTAP